MVSQYLLIHSKAVKARISGPHEDVGKVSSEEVGYYFKLCCLVTTLNYFTLYQYYVAASDWTTIGPRL